MRKFVIITRVIASVVIAWWVAVMFLDIFSCMPVNGFWDKSIPSKCINPTHYYIGVAIPNITTDVIMLALPVRMVWRLHTSLGHKIALSTTFLTGAM